VTPLPAPDDAPAPVAVACPVGDLAVLRFDGPDAAAFLHGQLSSDVAALAPGTLQWSSYNSPKGRMLANLLLARPAPGDGLRAVLAADLAAAIARRLAMFVLRARVKVADAGAERALVGIVGPGAAAAAAAAFGVAVVPGGALVSGDTVVLGLPDGRVLVEVATAARADALAALGPHVARAGEDAWRRAGVRAGVPLVTAATSDQFVPQALNFDALGGISFRKGCYPGQEIVARMHYLGRLKERLFAFDHHGDAPAPGTRLHAASFGDQPCGTVVNGVADGDDGTSATLLAVVQRSAAEGDVVHLGAPDGPVLVRRALPYAVPEPAPRERLRP
jgi:folate-binding protein YgfZ